MNATQPTENKASEAALSFGMEKAAKMFAKRPGQVERHLSQHQIAALLAIGYDAGVAATKTQVGIAFEVTDAQVRDIAITACEGGIGYWAVVEAYNPGSDDKPLNPDHVFALITTDESEATGPTGIAKLAPLTAEVIRRGIGLCLSPKIQLGGDIRGQIAQELYDPEGCGADQTAADCIVQAGLFNDVVYG